MQQLMQWVSSEALDAQVIHGISLGFILIFYVPLVLVVLAFSVFTIFAKVNPASIAGRLTMVWLVACVPAALLIVMGYAFNPYGWFPILPILLWVATGAGLLWLPVFVRGALSAIFSSRNELPR